ncbi:type IV secretory system conjugative DNA transfer family protein [Desulfosarcina ovata]|nr:DUF87 domain-containing protein [Desulfosarcina ovata]
MTTSLKIPAVITIAKGGCIEATAALTLTSIVSAELVSSTNDKYLLNNEALWMIQWEGRLKLMQALALWPDHTVLELRWTAHPDFQQPSQGQLWIDLVLKASADTKDVAVQAVVQGYLRLLPLLETHLPNITFEPIIRESVLIYHQTPFKTQSVLSIGRLKRRIVLSDSLPRISLGFGPLKEETGKEDCLDLCFPWSAAMLTSNELARGLMSLLDPIQLVVRLKAHRPTFDDLQRLENQIAECERFLSAGRADHIASTKQVAMIRDMTLRQLIQIRDASFCADAFLLSGVPMDEAFAVGLVQMILASTSDRDDNNLFAGGFTVSPLDLDNSTQQRGFNEKPISPQEAAAIFSLPLPAKSDVPGLPIRRWRTSTISFYDGNTISKKKIALFDNFHNGWLQPVSLTNEDRMRHMFVVGATGTGKSVFLANMILQDIAKGHGLCVIDPHGDMVESILTRIPERRAEDVIVMDVLDEWPVSFNLLQWDSIEQRDMIIDEMYHAMDLMYDMKETGGPIFENHFRNMLKLLCGDGSKQRSGFSPTVLDFERCYQDSDLRKWLKERTSEKEVIDFLQQIEKADYGDIRICNVSQYVTSKFGRFSSDTRLRRIFGQNKSSFSFDDILSQGRIFLVKMGRGRWGTEVSRLLASQLVARFKIAAMKRGAISEKDRKDFFLYVDEAGLIPPDSVGDLLSEARKYRLGVVLSTQYTKRHWFSSIGNLAKGVQFFILITDSYIQYDWFFKPAITY